MSTLWEAAEALRQAAVIRVSLLKAFKPGDVVILECERKLSPEQMNAVRDRFAHFIGDTGVKIIVLDPGMHVVVREEHSFSP